MIHHFARALAIRENMASTTPVQQSLFWPTLPRRAEPATRPARALVGEKLAAMERHGARVRRDPNDGRRALISGRFVDVCAALDRMVNDTEFEAA